jgi:glycosyltransferase involved in cell wall biosynthesis
LSHADVLPRLELADFFVNTSLTDSLDKAGLEAMACGLPVFATNDAYRDILSGHPRLLFARRNPADLADKIEALIKSPEADRKKLSSTMRGIVVEKHDLKGFAERLSEAIIGLSRHG